VLQKDDGIVLRSARSGETSQTVVFLGRASGKIRLMAKGALAPRSPWRGLFEPGRNVEAVYYFKEGRTLYYVKEAAPAGPAVERRDSLPHLAALLAATELLDQVCYPGSPDERIVEVAVDYVRHLDCPDPLFLFLAFEIKLLAELGASPEMTECMSCGGPAHAYSAREGSSYCREHAGVEDAATLLEETAELLRHCVSSPLATLAAMDVSARGRKQLGKLVHWTYTHHVHGYSLPKSLNLI
jgi:DNA repair protein RecO (recombination protein O)